MLVSVCRSQTFTTPKRLLIFKSIMLAVVVGAMSCFQQKSSENYCDCRS